jgi:CIC family chloride channel protein
MDYKKIAKKFFIWRLKHINDKNFMLILAVIVGITVGFAAIILKSSVNFVRNFIVYVVDAYSINYVYIVFPAIGVLLTVLFINHIIKKKLGHGIPMVLYSISKNEGKIDKHNMFSRIIASSLTVGFGGSVGLEGPIVGTGAAIGSNIGQMFRLSYKQIILLIGCASAGAIAAIFKAPITAIVFAIEVIMLDLTTASLLPLLLASISAALTSFIFSGQNFVYFVEKTDAFLLGDTPYYLLLGLLCGFISVYFSKLYLKINSFFEKINSTWKRFVIGSLILGTLIFLFPSLYGEGYEAVNMALHGNVDFLFESSLYPNWNGYWGVTILLGIIVLLKIFATGATFGAGGVGGIFAPSLFIGSILGLFFTNIIQLLGIELSGSNFALVGMTGLIAGVMHAPLTGIFMIAEITGGYGLFVPLMIVAAISFFTVRIFTPNSVYTILLAKRGELLTHNADSNMLTLLKMEPLIEKNFLTIKETGTLRDLVDIISKSSRTIYVVIDDDYNLKGIVWLDHVREIMFKPEFYDSVYVRDLMYMPSPIVEWGMSVKEIAELFETTEHYNLPIVQNGKYMGFISKAKVFSTYRKLLKNFSSD